MNVRIALPLASVLTALVAGCAGSSDKPQTLPTLTATPVATSSAAPVPTAAKAKTPQGAEAFVRFFFDRVNAAFSSSDSSLLAGLSDPRCGTCANYVKALDGNRTQVIQGPSLSITAAAAAQVQGESTVVEVFGVVPARKLVDRQGEVIQDLASDGSFHYSVVAVRGSDGWRVRAIRVNAS